MTQEQFNVEEAYFKAIGKVSNHRNNIEVHKSVSNNEYKGLNNKLLDLRAKESNFTSNIWASKKDMKDLSLKFKGEKEYGVQLFTRIGNKVRYYIVYNMNQLEKDLSNKEVIKKDEIPF